MTVAGKRPDHRHPTPDHVANLPQPVEQIGAQAREHVHLLLCCAAAGCDDCLRDQLRLLIEQQKTQPSPEVTSDGPVRSMTIGGQPQGPGPAEAVYADLLHLLSQGLATAAGRTGEDPSSSSVRYAQDFINSYPDGLDKTIPQVAVQTAASLVRQGCDPVAALELAQGVIPMFNMLSGDGHTQLAYLIDTCIGLVLAVAKTNNET